MYGPLLRVHQVQGGCAVGDASLRGNNAFECGIKSASACGAGVRVFFVSDRGTLALVPFCLSYPTFWDSQQVGIPVAMSIGCKTTIMCRGGRARCLLCKSPYSIALSKLFILQVQLSIARKMKGGYRSGHTVDRKLAGLRDRKI